MAAGVSRVTLNQLEGGLFADLGVRKVQAILGKLGLALAVEQVVKERKPDFVSMACTTASVSFKNILTEDELIRALLSGKAPSGKRPHLRALLDEGSGSLLRGLVAEAAGWSKPGKVEKNLATLAKELGSTRDTKTWLTTD
jgi:hypothetical protein